MSKYPAAAIAIIVLLVGLLPVLAQQTPAVTAEAVGQANLRAAPDVNSDIVGEITAGARYPVIGRSEFFPWLLLAEANSTTPKGWVFADLVTVQGNLNSVPFSALVITEITTTPSETPALVGMALPTATTSPAQPQITPTPTLNASVIGEVSGEVNVRYGPGVEYPRLGVAFAGENYEITAWHTQLPWLQIRFPDAPAGLAWIARDLLEVQGDLFSLPSISQTTFNLPTLTPTPITVQTSGLFGESPTDLSPEFQALGNELWNVILSAGFDPATSRFGALFLLDLQTGEALAFGREYAFSGTSISKIAIMARLYAALDGPPDTRTAIDIANTMICSENVATNRLLSVIGGGDIYLGADLVTEFERQLGLERTFLTAPYTIPGVTPEPPPRPIQLPQTSADQIKANPDPSNQLTVDEMGYLLGSIYQCAYEERGPLIEDFPGQFDPRECRQMLHVMSNNTVDALLKAGVPADTRVAHKHGWIDETHGNAAVFFTPGGNYVMVMLLHQPEWLFFGESLPVIAEVSRLVYNYYNPDAPMPEIREGFIPETANCNFAGSPLIDELMAATFDQ